MKGTQSDVRFLLAFLALSLGLNVFLGLRVLKGSPPPLPEPPLAAGDSAPPLELRTLGGEVETRRYSQDAKPTVLYVFTPSCRFCAANFDNIRHLAKKKSEAFHFVAISLDDKDLASYLKTHEYGFPVYSATPATQKAYRLTGVPQTLVVSTSGKVLRSWMGAYTDDAERGVESFFAVELPGLLEASHPPSAETAS